jgi:hypothetical protein
LKTKLGDRRIQIVVIAALGLIVVHNVRYFAQRNKTVRQPVQLDVLVEEAIVQAEAPRWASGGYVVTSEWGRDPFDPRGGTSSPKPESTPAEAERAARTPAPPRIRITGIGTVGGSRFVLAGDKILREGDRVGSGTIKKIGTESIVVEYDGGTKTIKMD